MSIEMGTVHVIVILSTVKNEFNKSDTIPLPSKYRGRNKCFVIINHLYLQYNYKYLILYSLSLYFLSIFLHQYECIRA